MVGTNDKYVFQGVHMLLNMSSSEELGMKLQPWQEGEKHLNKLCFIGRNLDRASLIEGLQTCIFDGKYPEPGEPPKTRLRFAVGNTVLVNVGDWKQGVVIALWYREPLWPTGHYVPYQVALQDGTAIWAPRDNDKFIRECKKKTAVKSKKNK